MPFDPSTLIPEKQITVLAPHYDDASLFLGGYYLANQDHRCLEEKQLHIHLLFSKSNYQARDPEGNEDRSPSRIQYATGIRLMEDFHCNDAIFGQWQYGYQLHGLSESLTRGKTLGKSAMEFPHGTLDDFDEEDHRIMQYLKGMILPLLRQHDTALIVPVGFRENIDHFITREATILAIKELGKACEATVYFVEDKPYAGLANDTEKSRVDAFIAEHQLIAKPYRYPAKTLVELIFEHFPSQVEDIYREGILNRVAQLSKIHHTDETLDCFYQYPTSAKLASASPRSTNT